MVRACKKYGLGIIIFNFEYSMDFEEKESLKLRKISKRGTIVRL